MSALRLLDYLNKSQPHLDLTSVPVFVGLPHPLKGNNSFGAGSRFIPRRTQHAHTQSQSTTFPPLSPRALTRKRQQENKQAKAQSNTCTPSLVCLTFKLDVRKDSDELPNRYGWPNTTRVPCTTSASDFLVDLVVCFL